MYTDWWVLPSSSGLRTRPSVISRAQSREMSTISKHRHINYQANVRELTSLPRNLVSEQIDGVSGASQRGYKTIGEAERDYKLLKREGKLVACPDPVDDGSDASEVSINGRRANGNSTSASSTPRRDTSARTRARADRPRQPDPDASSGEAGGAARERDGGRQRARSPVREASPARRDHTRVKTEPRQTGAASPRSTRRETRETPVQVHTDDDSDGPQPRTPPRRDPRAPHTESPRRADYRYDSLFPEPHESISSPPRRRQAPGMTRESSQSSQYHSARSVVDSDENAAHERGSRGRADSSASLDSIPDSSSAPTGETQREDPEGGLARHEWRRADINARKAQRAARAKVPVAVSDAEETEPENIVEYVELPPPSRGGTPKRPKAPPAQRAQTEPVFGSTPVTPVPLAKSKSMPASTNGSVRMRYKVCAACHQPLPQPPLFSPEDEGTSRAAACGRCFQPLPPKRASSAGSSVPQSPAQSEKTVKSSHRQTSTTVNETVNMQNGNTADDLLNSLGLSPFPQPFDVHSSPDDPRSPYKGPTSLPVRFVYPFPLHRIYILTLGFSDASNVSSPFVREPTFGRPSPAASVDGRAGHSRLNSLSSESGRVTAVDA